MDTFTYVRAQTLCKKGHHMEKNNLNCVKKQSLCTDVAWEQFVFSEHLGVAWIELTALVVARVTWFGGLSLESRWQTRASLQLTLAGILQGVIVGRCWYEPCSSGAGHFPTLVSPSIPVLCCTVVTHGHHDMQKFASFKRICRTSEVIPSPSPSCAQRLPRASEKQQPSGFRVEPKVVSFRLLFWQLCSKTFLESS